MTTTPDWIKQYVHPASDAARREKNQFMSPGISTKEGMEFHPNPELFKLKRVYITKDDDGHYFVIPWIMKDEFNSLLEKLIKCDYEDDELMTEWDLKFGKYMCGGDPMKEYTYYAHIE